MVLEILGHLCKNIFCSGKCDIFGTFSYIRVTQIVRKNTRRNITFSSFYSVLSGAFGLCVANVPAKSRIKKKTNKQILLNAKRQRDSNFLVIILITRIFFLVIIE